MIIDVVLVIYYLYILVRFLIDVDTTKISFDVPGFYRALCR
jgi:hypothetical protein